jgi:hypothetical protein
LAHNRFSGVEDLTEEELAAMRSRGVKTKRLRDALSAADQAEAPVDERASDAADHAQPNIR